MKKSTCLEELQKRLPGNLVLVDETPFEFTEDEFIGILSWFKLFSKHYEESPKKLPLVPLPLVSHRIFLDFGLFLSADDDKLSPTYKKHVVIINENDKDSLDSNITRWQL